MISLARRENSETQKLMKQFISKTDNLSETTRIFDFILATLTAATCPLSPCDDCELLNCILREDKKEH